jgi:hypothetical protein
MSREIGDSCELMCQQRDAVSTSFGVLRLQAGSLAAW